MVSWIKSYFANGQFSNTLERAKHWLLLALGLFLAGLFLKLAHNVLYDSEDMAWIQRWDNAALLFVSAHRSGALTTAMIDITALGSITIVALIAFIFLVVFYLLRDKFGILQLALASVGAGFWTWAFKHFVERPRPTIIAQLVAVTGNSFPSGHALASATLYFTFATMAGKHFESWRRALALQALAAIGILGVAFSRVYLGVHYPSDVLSGALFGAAWAYFLAGAVAWASIKNKTTAKQRLS